MIDFLQMNKNLVEILNDLARCNVNGKFTYLYAARGVKSEALSLVFEQYAAQRERLIDQLDCLTKSLNARLYVNSDMNSLLYEFRAIHKSAGEYQSELDWLMRCLEQDAITLQTYDVALSQRLPIHIYGFVCDHHEQIAQARLAVEQLYLTHRYWSTPEFKADHAV